MNGWGRRALVGLALCGLIAAGAPAVHAEEDIRARLEAIPGMSVLRDEPAADGYRFLMLSYRQPVDHRHLSAGTFQQRFQLMHRSTDAPMVLHTSGYDVRETPFRSEPARLINGNQISTEQRFFTPSRPDPADWTKLNIWQAATDHNRLVTVLKPIYDHKWISTGASKGGMASVYHRRFYPGDVDGTVAYVAPNDVVNSADSAYTEFFDKVGSDPACQTALENVQRTALKRRAEMVARYEAWAREGGFTFDILRTVDRAFEIVVLDTAWAFWQFSGEAACAQVPAKDAPTEEVYAFIDGVTGFSFYTDQGLTPFVPYYYQAATQLGGPFPSFAHLRGLLRYPGLYASATMVPQEIPTRFEPGVMRDIDSWVRRRGSELLFVYGENDPWGAEPFRLGRGTRDSLWFEAPRANHGANIAALTAADRTVATAALLRWAGVDAAARATTFVPELDTVDPLMEQRPPL